MRHTTRDCPTPAAPLVPDRTPPRTGRPRPVRPFLRRFLHRFLRRGGSLLGGLLLLLPGCAGPGSGGGSGEFLRVALRDYRADARFELVSEGDTDRLKYYSKAREDAGRKFQTDEVMTALVEHLDDEGFSDFAQAGKAPTTGSNVLALSFEVEQGTVIRCWPIGSGSDPGELEHFKTCVRDFLDLYNVSQGFQAVRNPEGHDLLNNSTRQKTGR